MYYTFDAISEDDWEIVWCDSDGKEASWEWGRQDFLPISFLSFSCSDAIQLQAHLDVEFLLLPCSMLVEEYMQRHCVGMLHMGLLQERPRSRKERGILLLGLYFKIPVGLHSDMIGFVCVCCVSHSKASVPLRTDPFSIVPFPPPMLPEL